MKVKLTYCIVLLLLCLYSFGRAKNEDDANKLYLYTDRNYCLSGDSLWFKVWLPENVENSTNVVRMQLNSSAGNVVASVACKGKNQWAEGFMYIPDSLSSGVYYVLAFVNQQRNAPNLQLGGKTLFIYNRFEDGIFEMNVPKPELVKNQVNNTDIVGITLNKLEYNKREKVDGTINVKAEIIHATLSAKIVDPLAESNGGNIKFSVVNSEEFIPDFAEKDGVLLSGKVSSLEDNIPQENKLVLLSISTEPPYFDYCVSDEYGGFNFFLPNASGTANVVLQAIGTTNEELLITTEANTLTQNSVVETEPKILSQQQSEFIKDVVQANFMSKLFKPSKISVSNSFEMPQLFSLPFYGKASKRIIPDEFIDLPNFKEISRELIHGVQYRIRNDEPTLRLLNNDQRHFFENEPLRLLNGIPIFKNSLLNNLKSTDINYIDVVEAERIFGDLIFTGVFAVSLHNKSNSWLTQQPNIFQFNYNCLQPDKRIGYTGKPKVEINEPDMRQNYLWEILNNTEGSNFSFYLSDLSGRIEITVEGLTKNKVVFKTSKIIEVK